MERETAARPHHRGGRGWGGRGGGRGGDAGHHATPRLVQYVETRTRVAWALADPTAAPRAEQDAANRADMQLLFDRLPDGPMRASIAEAVAHAFREHGHVLKELYLAFGRRCELVFATAAGGSSLVLRSNELVDDEHLRPFAPLFDGLGAHARRTGVDGTLHRISRSVHTIRGGTCAITARVGRTIQGHVLPLLAGGSPIGSEAEASRAVAELASRSLLLIGTPNTGKTTALRELARLLSLGDARVVVIVDKSLEIAGTAVVPHGAIGNARVLTAESSAHQHKAMLEAVENQSPDFVVIDEISSKEECQAARTIAGRGVALVASVHGDSLAGLLADAERSVLLGGVQAVTLSAREAEARPDRRRTVQKRYGAPVFGAAVELRSFADCVVHADVQGAIDALLDHAPVGAAWHRVEGHAVSSTPVVAVPCEGRAPAYAALACGERVAADTDFAAQTVGNVPVASGGVLEWRALTEASPRVYSRVSPAPGEGGLEAMGAAFTFA